jgi:UMF1 family MFS transporter
MKDLKDTFREIRRYRQIVRLLVARMIYNDGLVTIFAFGGIYAAGTFGFSFQEIMIFGMVLNVAAGIGALIMGIFDDRLGGKTTIQVSNAALALAVLMAVLAPDKPMFWVAGILVGFFAGPNQSASRSLLGRLVPEGKENQFYGFFAFSGKLTAFLGPLLLGVLTRVFDSQRAGVSVVALFFIAGGLLLSRVDEQEGKAAARRES